MQICSVAIVTYGFLDHVLKLVPALLIYLNVLKKLYARISWFQIDHVIEDDEKYLLVTSTSLIIITNVIKNNLSSRS